MTSPRTLGGPGSGNFGHQGGEGGPGNPGGSTSNGTVEARKLAMTPYAERILDDVDKGNSWKLKLDRVRDGYENTHVFRVEPKTVPSRIAVVNVGMAKYPSKAFYDPTLADVVTDAEGYTSVQPKAGLSEDTEISESGYLYRGLSYEEWREAQRTGELKSEGGYNLGEQQRGYTYFSTDAGQATHYASGFAPWQYKPSFDHPAIVVKIKDPGTARIDTSTERAIPGSVSLRDVITMYEGHPYVIKSGEIEFYQGAAGGKYTEGSRMSPSVSVVWKRKEFHTALSDHRRTLARPLKFEFDIASQEAVDWADKHAAELIDGITETTREAINNAIAEGLESGDIESAYKEILDAVGNKDRARLIAHHETMAAASEGQRISWAQAVEEGLLTGDEMRTWIAVGDDKVCPICEDLDGRTTDLNGEYDEGISGPPAHVACRCTEGLV